MGAHARKNASGCKRWSACPGSLVLSEGRPNESSGAARLGTAAHGLGEHCLNRPDLWPSDMLRGLIYLDEKEDASVYPPPEACSVDQDGDKRAHEGAGHESFEIDADMVDAVTVYVSAVREELERLPGSELMVERRFDLSSVRPEMFGTNDACVLQIFDHLTVFDYKHGQGVVVEVAEEVLLTLPDGMQVLGPNGEALYVMKGNPQLMYYALGVAKELDWAFETLDLVIVQPRARHADGGVRRYSTGKAELLEFEQWLGKASDRADDAAHWLEGNAPANAGHGRKSILLHEAGLLRAGKHCQFCPNAGIPCPALMDEAYEQAKLDFVDGEPQVEAVDEGTTDERLAQAMKAVQVLDIFSKAVVAETLRRLSGSPDGTGLGYKLVRKKSNRKWVDEAEAFAELEKRGFPKEDLYDPPKARTPSKVEALRPAGLMAKLREQGVKAPVKAVKDIVAGLTHKPEGGVTLAPMDDPRDPVAPSTLAAADFEAVDE